MSSTNFPNDNRRKNLLTLQTLSESKFLFLLEYPQGFPGAQTVKNLPTMRETWVRPLGWEDPLEEKMATHSSILAWRIPWAEEPGGSWGRIELNTTERLTLSQIRPRSVQSLGRVWLFATPWTAARSKYGPHCNEALAMNEKSNGCQVVFNYSWRVDFKSSYNDLLYSTWNCSVLRASLDGHRLQGRMDTCMCTAESLCCSPKTTVTLLIGYI